MHSMTHVLMVLATTLAGSGALAFAAPPTEACTVLTTSQVGSALGMTVGEGSYIMPAFKETCTWNIQGGGAVTLHLESLAMFNAGKGSMASAERAAASGVGDEAYYLGLGSTTALHVRKGSGAFQGQRVYQRPEPGSAQGDRDETRAAGGWEVLTHAVVRARLRNCRCQRAAVCGASAK